MSQAHETLRPGETYVLARATDSGHEYLYEYSRLSAFRGFTKTLGNARTFAHDNAIFTNDWYCQARQGLLIMRLHPINVGSFAPIEYERVV